MNRKQILKLISAINVKILYCMHFRERKDLKYYFERKEVYKQALHEYELQFKGIK